MFVFNPGSVPNRIVIVGGGGTGGRLVALLSQFIKTCNWVINPTIYIIDGDEVEQKNLARQNFISMDVGQPKAVVLANRYGAARDVPIVPIVQMITPQTRDSILQAMDYETRRPTLVISCVDNVEARRDLLSLATRLVSPDGSPAFVIDSGNEDDYGQVMWYHATGINSEEDYLSRITSRVADAMKVNYTTVPSPVIPLPFRFYTNLKDTGKVSCADLDQTLAVNNMAAAHIMNAVQRYYQNKRFSSVGVSFSLEGASNVMPFDLTYMLSHVRTEVTQAERAYLREINLPSYRPIETSIREYVNAQQAFAQRIKEQDEAEARKKRADAERERREEKARKDALAAAANPEGIAVPVEAAKPAEAVFVPLTPTAAPTPDASRPALTPTAGF